MKTFKQFLEDVINYNHHSTSWQVRDNDTKRMKYDDSHVIIKSAKPHIDYDAHEDGKRVYAYMKGDVVKSADLSNHTKREIKFNKGSLDKPFSHKDDDSKVTHADYVEFHNNKVHAYYKQ